jgi:type I restriction enzyme M protein
VNARGPDTEHKAVSRSDPRNHAAFIWSVADLLRGDYKRSEYGKVILPLTVLRRLDGVLAPTKQYVLAKHQQLQGRLSNVGPV